MSVIAMTREMGSCGEEIAYGLAEKLRIEIVHREVVEHDVAERVHMPEAEGHRFLEGPAQRHSSSRTTTRQLAYCTAEEVFKLAARGNIIIRGWGATSLLRAIPHVVCVRVCAPMDFRVRVLMDRLQISDAALAQREIEHNDAAHTRAMQIFLRTDWQDPLGYDIVINTERVPVEVGIEQVSCLVKHPAFQESAASRRILADKIIEARVRSMIAENLGDGIFGRTIDITAHSGRVTLSGAVRNSEAVARLAEFAYRVEGVTEVENNIIAVGKIYK